MIPFKVFTEKRVSNPLRKTDLAQSGSTPYTDPIHAEDWKDIIKYSDDVDIGAPEWIPIKRQYEKLRVTLPPRAEQYLDQEAKKYIDRIKRPSTRDYKKIYECYGLQVFADLENLSGDFSPNSRNLSLIKDAVNKMLLYIKDIIPNRKPKIIITDLGKNKYTKNTYSNEAAGLQFSKNIFIDEKYLDDPVYYIHEYAHQLTDSIPTQTNSMLVKAYKDMLDLYFKKVKKRKIQPEEINDNIRRKISQKLGFPMYGLTNPDELFAIIIENWKKFPNNALTYRFKSIVKDIITRL